MINNNGKEWNHKITPNTNTFFILLALHFWISQITCVLHIQAIIWTNAGLLLIWPLQTNLSGILIEVHIFSFKKITFKISFGKWRSLCIGLSVLNICKVSVGLSRTRNVGHSVTRNSRVAINDDNCYRGNIIIFDDVKVICHYCIYALETVQIFNSLGISWQHHTFWSHLNPNSNHLQKYE